MANDLKPLYDVITSYENNTATKKDVITVFEKYLNEARIAAKISLSNNENDNARYVSDVITAIRMDIEKYVLDHIGYNVYKSRTLILKVAKEAGIADSTGAIMQAADKMYAEFENSKKLRHDVLKQLWLLLLTAWEENGYCDAVLAIFIVMDMVILKEWGTHEPGGVKNREIVIGEICRIISGPLAGIRAICYRIDVDNYAHLVTECGSDIGGYTTEYMNTWTEFICLTDLRYEYVNDGRLYDDIRADYFNKYFKASNVTEWDKILK